VTRTDVTPIRKRRANGEASRRKILDAAAEIAGERGYEGTSINLVSERSGLPVSSIYWHFTGKDELIAAVIDRSFTEWVGRLQQPPADDEADPFHAGLRRTGQALADFPDFLRLGLMLILERRPDEPTARAKYIDARHVTIARTVRLYRRSFPDLEPAAIDQLAALTIALADGLFIANQVEGTPLDHAFDLMATVIEATAERLHTA
jgi:AcrR family transcriptional regulator